MLPAILKENTRLTVSKELTPTVSIVMPFDPKMTSQSFLVKRLQDIFERVSNDLAMHYSASEIKPVLSRLHKLINNLNYSTYKKSIAIFITREADKIYYLDVHVKERIVVDKKFTLRDLIESKHQTGQFVLLVLSAQCMKIFLGSSQELKRILSSVPDNVMAYKNDIAERVSNFSDPSARKEILLDKFMRYADNAIDSIMKAYPYPLFIMATERTAGHFRKITGNASHIVGYVHGNFEDASEAVIRKAVEPHIAVWEEVKQQHLLNRLEQAMSTGKLVTGMRAVYLDACRGKGQLLVVERNCTSPLTSITGKDPSERPFYIKDAIDVVIEKVLASGGDVELVNEGALIPYRKIALVKYY